MTVLSDYPAEMEDIYNLQALIREMGRDITRLREVVVELQKEHKDLKEFVHQTVFPQVNESRYN